MNLASFWHGLAREFRFSARAARRQESAFSVLRGDSWSNNNRDNLLSSNRNNNNPDNRNETLVFVWWLSLDSGAGRKSSFQDGA